MLKNYVISQNSYSIYKRQIRIRRRKITYYKNLAKAACLFKNRVLFYVSRIRCTSNIFTASEYGGCAFIFDFKIYFEHHNMIQSRQKRPIRPRRVESLINNYCRKQYDSMTCICTYAVSNSKFGKYHFGVCARCFVMCSVKAKCADRLI